MNIDEIKKILPHRYPFLLVDKVTKIEDNSIEGIKNVSQNEPFFQGHFPDYPIMPGVLIVEAMAQLGGILLLQKFEKKKTPLFLGIDKIRFRKQVRPGDTIWMKASIKKLRTNIAILKVEATVDRELVTEGELLVGTK